jgi:hypothetical protein
MMTVPRLYPQNMPIYEHQPSGFGSLLSVLTLGLIKDTPAGPSKQDIMAQVGLQVVQALANQCMEVDSTDAVNSAGYNLNQFDAWGTVLSDTTGQTTQMVVNKTISDLIGSGLVQVAPGCANAGAPVTTQGVVAPTATAATAASTSSIEVSPEVLAIGGGAAVLMLLLLGHHKKKGRR